MYKKDLLLNDLRWVIRGAFNKFPDFFFGTGIWNCRRHLKIQYLIAIHLMRWLTKFYDFRFKWTATAAIGIHPTKAWSSQLVNFKNSIWTWGHFTRTICNKILFETCKKCHRNLWSASDCVSSILHESSISFWVAWEIQRRQGVRERWWEVWEE